MEATGKNAAAPDSPGVVQNFRRLFSRAAADGRGEALFGADALEKAAAALRRGAVAGMGDGVGFYFEFPFTGAPRMDLMVQYDCCDLPSPVDFCEGDGCGFRPFFEDCAADPALSDYICGFSFDISDMADKGEEAKPGVYLLPPVHRANADYVPPMLTRLGGEDRVPRVMEAFAAAPSCWQPYYAGYMPGRRGAPTRLGFLVSMEGRARYAKEPERFLEDAEAFAGLAFSDGGRGTLAFLAESGELYDLQFDLCPDGDFADDLGVTLHPWGNDADPRSSAGFLEKSFAGKLMERIEAVGLADARWRLMDKACCGVQRVMRTGGRLRRIGDMVALNAVKVRFRRGEAYLAKGYLFARSRIL